MQLNNNNSGDIYPENCLKGIPNNSFLNENGEVHSHLFHFDKQFSREDGWTESSINWEDDNNALFLILLQRKDNYIQFKSGIARLIRNELDKVKSLPGIINQLSYERREIENINPYHGNLLLRNEVISDKAKMRQIAGTIALCVKEVIPQTNN